MSTRIVLLQENYYISLETGEVKLLSEDNVRNFLKNYDTFCDSAEFNVLPTEKIELGEGVTVACVDDTGKLCISSTTLLKDIFYGDVSSYITTEEYAAKHDRQRSIVLRLCRQGRLDGIIQKGATWLIPEDTPYPKDERVGARVKITEQRIKRK